MKKESLIYHIFTNELLPTTYKPVEKSNLTFMIGTGNLAWKPGSSSQEKIIFYYLDVL